MSPSCTVCVHPDRDELEARLAAGGSTRDVAGQFGVSKSAVHRHLAEHLPVALRQATAAAEVARGDALLEQVERLQARALAILEAAEQAGDLRTALGAIREARGNLELLGKLAGELTEAPQVNILVSAEWIAIRGAVATALAPYPQARVAVATAMARLEQVQG